MRSEDIAAFYGDFRTRENDTCGERVVIREAHSSRLCTDFPQRIRNPAPNLRSLTP